MLFKVCQTVRVIVVGAAIHAIGRIQCDGIDGFPPIRHEIAIGIPIRGIGIPVCRSLVDVDQAIAVKIVRPILNHRIQRGIVRHLPAIQHEVIVTVIILWVGPIKRIRGIEIFVGVDQPVQIVIIPAIRPIRRTQSQRIEELPPIRHPI